MEQPSTQLGLSMQPLSPTESQGMKETAGNWFANAVLTKDLIVAASAQYCGRVQAKQTLCSPEIQSVSFLSRTTAQNWIHSGESDSVMAAL
jgi:hypothetical protein